MTSRKPSERVQHHALPTASQVILEILDEHEERLEKLESRMNLLEERLVKKFLTPDHE